MIVDESTVWLIMSKDRKLVAKGTPRNRCLVDVNDKTDKKRYLTYSSKGKAEAGFKVSGFWGMPAEWERGERGKYLQAVECKMTLTLVTGDDKRDT